MHVLLKKKGRDPDEPRPPRRLAVLLATTLAWLALAGLLLLATLAGLLARLLL
jgi:hypothetical protein